MTKNSLMGQVARWAETAGASPERVRNYAERAGIAFDQFTDISAMFARSFNATNPQKVAVSPDSVAHLVARYNRELLNFKRVHGISVEKRIDTHICAGLWFCAAVHDPVFGCDDGAAGEWDTATQEQLDGYYRLVTHFAFYIAFQILRGHYNKYEEVYLLNILQPIRKFMVDHMDSLADSPAAPVGIFLAVSVFDKDCKAPAILS